MECHCIPQREVPRTTRLYRTYSEKFTKVDKFYEHPPDERGVRSAARCAEIDADTRESVAEILREQNRALGGDAAVQRNIERFGRGAVVVIGGQQVGLFGGPAYTMYKALTAIEWSERLTRAGVDAVPIFWMATQDHDLAEVNHAVFGGGKESARLELAVAENLAGRSVGEIPLGSAVRALLDHAARLMEGQGRKRMGEALAAAYQEPQSLGTAFGRLLTALLAGRGLLLLDPLDCRLHKFARPIYRKAAQQAAQLTADLLGRSKMLDAQGFHAQVKITRQSTLLFLETEGKRQPLRQKNGAFTTERVRLSPSELEEVIEKKPETITANVLLRPVVQDSFLPTAAYIGGPAEIAYFAQAQVVYTRLGVRMPAILPRASFTLIEPEVQRLLSRYKLAFTDIWKGRQSVRRKMESRFLSPGLAARFARDERALERLLDAYRAPLTRVDKTLSGALETAERKILYQLGRLRCKAGRARDFRTGVLDRHEGQMFGALFPHHGLQERSLNLLPFLSRHGMALLDVLAAEIQKPCAGHRVVSL